MAGSIGDSFYRPTLPPPLVSISFLKLLPSKGELLMHYLIFSTLLPTTCASYACNSSSECKNNACGKASAENGANQLCCRSGKTTRFKGSDDCTKMSNGVVCWRDVMCASRRCKGNIQGLRRGKCATNGAFFGLCRPWPWVSLGEVLRLASGAPTPCSRTPSLHVQTTFFPSP